MLKFQVKRFRIEQTQLFSFEGSKTLLPKIFRVKISNKHFVIPYQDRAKVSNLLQFF